MDCARVGGGRTGPRVGGECSDGGAQFTIGIPVAAQRRRGKGRRVHERSGRILLVDDEVSIQRAVGPLLRSRGYEVESAGTGAEALRLVADRAPDLIVLDLGLPDIEGTEVCRRIRETLQVPIIVLSARGAEADKVNALDLGADDYVTKPFGPEELLARESGGASACDRPETPTNPGAARGRSHDRL